MNNLSIAKSNLTENKFTEAFDALVEGLDSGAGYSVLSRSSRVFEKIPRDALGLQRLKLAIIGTSTTDHLLPVIRLFLAREGFDAELYNAEYDTLDQTILNPNSGLYEFQPDVVWLFTNYRDVAYTLKAGSALDDVEVALEDAVNQYVSRWEAVRNHSNAYILQNNADLPVQRPLGNLDGNLPWGRLGFLRRFNIALADAADPGLCVLDIDHLSSIFGKAEWFDDRYWHYSKHAMSINTMGLLCHQAARLIGALKGKAKKCIVLDLDNTLWGGVIGDDGPQGIQIGQGTVEGESYSKFQDYLLALKERGIILAVCSKNEESIAAAAFEETPGMTLKLDDFAAFVANWSNKADNIIQIAETLDIGLDSMVFVDDNPVERDLVRSMLPMVAVPELPEDPSQYLKCLDNECYTELLSFTSEDSQRTDLYRANATRKEAQSKYSNLDDFLEHLDMESISGRFDVQNLPRIAQLINKSNQFHLTTTRYTEAEIQVMVSDENKVCRYYKLTDRHGDNGLISATILEGDNADGLIIDTWVMSCRVLSRSMEEFICNRMVEDCKALNKKYLIGKYLPTPKNKLVKNLYPRLGFREISAPDSGETVWRLDVRNDQTGLPTFVRSAKKGGVTPAVASGNQS